MENFLNIWVAWIATGMAVALSIIYILRVVNRDYFGNKNTVLKYLNKTLRNYHKFIGMALIITGVVHGYFSSQSVLSLNLGTASWVLSILLGMNFMFRKAFKQKSWIYYHRIMTILFVAVLTAHISQVTIFSNNGAVEAKSSEVQYSQSVSSSATSTSVQSSSSDGSSVQVVSPSTTSYKDGTYTGVGNGYRPNLTVKVTIKNNKITNIQMVSNNETPNFLNRAVSTVTQEIISQQSTNVDVVSGASRSSNGIMQAVEDALQQATV